VIKLENKIACTKGLMKYLEKQLNKAREVFSKIFVKELEKQYPQYKRIECQCFK